MKIFRNKNSLIKEISGLKDLAFIPTMGSLHKGHMSLINKAKKESKQVLVSIYVNSKQFSSKKDFKTVPGSKFDLLESRTNDLLKERGCVKKI